MNASDSPLMISVAGIRGIVGSSLTMPIASRFAAAFARSLPPGHVVVGRDARPSGATLYHAVAAGLRGAGRDVVDLGLATTPTTEIAVERTRAAGGVILTASHNPAPWNALKFLDARGEFLGPEAGAAVRAAFEADAGLWVPAAALGGERPEPDALAWHVERVLGLDVIEPERIRGRALKVAVDGCSSVGGFAVPALLRALGAMVIEVDCAPDGDFRRELEPLPEHLGRLGGAVLESGCDFGVALDPDADRAAFVDAGGVPLGEEFTLALGLGLVLAKHPGPAVTNLSTSRIVDAVCTRAGVPLRRTPVGEAHVVAGMRAAGAVAGGEGTAGPSLRALADALPSLHMTKRKSTLPPDGWPAAASRLRRAFAAHVTDEADGLRFARGEEWVHVRPSGTEPVVRIIAESPAETRTSDLVERARAALQG